MSSDLDNQLLKACTEAKWGLIPALVLQGADVMAEGKEGRTPLFQVIGEIAYTWPKHRGVFDLLVEKGADINYSSGAHGSPMHALSYMYGILDPDQDLTRFQTFLREAVDRRGGDFATRRNNYPEGQAAISDFMQAASSFNGVARTIMSIANDNPDMFGAHERNQMVKSWITTVHTHPESKGFGAWYSAGLSLEGLAIEPGYKADRAIADYEAWKQENQVVAVEEVTSPKQIFTGSTRAINGRDVVSRRASPLFRPENWEQLDALADACAKHGEPVKPEHLLEPVVEDRNFVQIGAEIACRPNQAIRFCNRHGLQLGAKELLQPDGSPNATLQSLIDVKAAHLLFTQNNWKGKHPAELHKVLNALPEADRNLVRNVYQLRAHMQDTNTSEIGRA